MNREGMKKTAILTGIFALVSMSVMLYRAGTKHIVIADAAVGREIEGMSGKAYDIITETSDKTNASGEDGLFSMEIPLPGGTSSEDIVVEDRYVYHQFVLYVKGKDRDYYRKKAVKHTGDAIISAQCFPQDEDEGVCLRFQLNGLYDSETLLTDSGITVNFWKPEDKYDNIVVIDPVGGGEDIGESAEGVNEKDLSLLFAKKIKEYMDRNSNADCRVYFTRLTDLNPEPELRNALIKDSGADLYIQLGTAAVDSKESGVYTYYNDLFFIRKFGNARLADFLEKNTAYVTGQDARGIFTEKDGSKVLQNITVPSALLCPGNIMNDGDRVFMQDEKGMEKAAEGVGTAIEKAFDIINADGPKEEDEEVSDLSGEAASK